MGAVYLDVRARGYKGWAKLADSHPQVRDFWLLVHQSPDVLIEAADMLKAWPSTADGYYAMKEQRVDEFVERVARFLWMTNIAYGNVPVLYTGSSWKGPGTKMTSAAKWNKTFPWKDCVERLKTVGELVQGQMTLITDDGIRLLQEVGMTDQVYADPPYRGQSGYDGSVHSDYINAIASSSGSVVLSESSEVAHELSGWDIFDGSVTARMSSGVGATGKRREVIYVRGAAR